MTNTIVTVTETEVNALRATWDAACEAQRQAHAANAATPSIKHLDAVLAASRAERIAHDAWKAGEKALQAMWRAELEQDENARLQAMCEAHDALEWDYADYSEGFLTEPIPYALTDAGVTYLDHHYQTSL